MVVMGIVSRQLIHSMAWAAKRAAPLVLTLVVGHSIGTSSALGYPYGAFTRSCAGCSARRLCGLPLARRCTLKGAALANDSRYRDWCHKRIDMLWMVVRIRAKMAQRKKLAWPLRSSQLLLAVERLVANDGWVTSRVKAVSRRRRGPQARLYRACHPAILDHRGRRLTPATLLPPPSMRGFTPPVTHAEEEEQGWQRGQAA